MSGFRKVLDVIETYAGELQAIGEGAPPAPRWNQDWFPRLDAAAAYAMVRSLRPRHIVEVGSGHSTRFMARAIADGRLATKFTAIDPQPRASIEGLKVDFHKARVQEAGRAPFDALAEGDILFIDSSHQKKPGSDVELLVDKIIPVLPPGVMVHFHDIFLPDPYPDAWAWRRYNEQEAVADLVERKIVEIEFSSHQAAASLAGVLASLPLMPGAHESSLWLTKT